MRDTPRSVSIALLFVVLHALIWFGFAVLAAALVGLAWLLRRRYRPAYYLTLATFGVLAILTFTDQVGPVDLVYLALALAPAALLIKDRGWYLRVDTARRTGAA